MTYTPKDLERAHKAVHEGPPYCEVDRVAKLIAAVREECAKVCDRLAEMREQGGGEHPRGQRLRQAARLIRELGK